MLTSIIMFHRNAASSSFSQGELEETSRQDRELLEKLSGLLWIIVIMGTQNTISRINRTQIDKANSVLQKRISRMMPPCDFSYQIPTLLGIGYQM